MSTVTQHYVNGNQTNKPKILFLRFCSLTGGEFDCRSAARLMDFSRFALMSHGKFGSVGNVLLTNSKWCLIMYWAADYVKYVGVCAVRAPKPRMQRNSEHGPADFTDRRKSCCMAN